jgi:hypothetical protein
VDVHIIFTSSAVLLTRRSYASWRQIQGEFDDYKASLGPRSPEDVIEWLATEYSDLSPAARDQVRAFLNGEEETVEVTFAPRSSRS